MINSTLKVYESMPIKWLNQNIKYFSVSMNGYHRPPVGAYLSTLPLIDRDGKIVDLGCGNGMLLKFLTIFSKHDLDPFGIDFNREAIMEAKEKVLPEYADQFYVSDIIQHKFTSGPYNIIIVNPYYCKININIFTQKCLDNLLPGGKLIYRIHVDVLKNNNINNVENEFKNLEMKISQGYDLIFGTYEK
jgi:SAM-dependent methyltransferase